jgi:hypothetical protein
MSNVIEFKKKEFKSGVVLCEHCCHEWVAVWPVDAEPLECPSCLLLRGRELRGPSLRDYVKLPNGATVTNALDAYLHGIKEANRHPSPQLEQRKPLSEEEIDQELLRNDYYSRSFTAGVRWAEKMHKIGVGDE